MFSPLRFHLFFSKGCLLKLILSATLSTCPLCRSVLYPKILFCKNCSWKNIYAMVLTYIHKFTLCEKLWFWLAISVVQNKKNHEFNEVRNWNYEKIEWLEQCIWKNQAKHWSKNIKKSLINVFVNFLVTQSYHILLSS